MKVNPIIRFAVERRVTMAMAVLGVLVLGWLSLDKVAPGVPPDLFVFLHLR